MKKILAMLVFVLMFGVTLRSPAILAGEHGGKELAGGGQEHGGTAMEGSHHHGEGTAATIMEAASILKATHPDLAAKLEAIAAEEK